MEHNLDDHGRFLNTQLSAYNSGEASHDKRSLPSSQRPHRDGSGADFQDVPDQIAATIKNSDRFIGSNPDFERARRNNGGASSQDVLEPMPTNFAGAGEFINTEPTYYPWAISTANGAHPYGKDLQRDSQLALPNDGGVPAQGETIPLSPILDNDETLIDPQPNNAPARPNQHGVFYEDVPDLDHSAESDTAFELHEIEGPEYNVAIQLDEVEASGQDFYDPDMNQEFSGAPPLRMYPLRMYPTLRELCPGNQRLAPRASRGGSKVPQQSKDPTRLSQGLPKTLDLADPWAQNSSAAVGQKWQLLPNYKANWEEPVLCHKEVNRYRKAHEGRDHCENRIHDSASEIIRSNKAAKAPSDEKGPEDKKYHDADKSKAKNNDKGLGEIQIRNAYPNYG
ncbi:hypothetical protein B0T26DRAFT_670893 [Lasiosphaeria miniovina]|uniref:Uncharacterized protein n=1 Tax=Lasiosphaeria miniovina TaxID=1954250 RepID=A0AA40BI41_9PEZI|nr:uncharacterized protein B0T26DRAFT_670893 [Lasiosphaeria miniovina]KAK0734624.1 hypothetical protein B0T26DRAFT_670893 [Lasiosphaeria miniovina]